MNSLELRDLKRAERVVADLRAMHDGAFVKDLKDIIPLIANALLMERAETLRAVRKKAK